MWGSNIKAGRVWGGWGNKRGVGGDGGLCSSSTPGFHEKITKQPDSSRPRALRSDWFRRAGRCSGCSRGLGRFQLYTLTPQAVTYTHASERMHTHTRHRTVSYSQTPSHTLHIPVHPAWHGYFDSSGKLLMRQKMLSQQLSIHQIFHTFSKDVCGKSNSIITITWQRNTKTVQSEHQSFRFLFRQFR